jgi:hypothetical protein
MTSSCGCLLHVLGLQFSVQLLLVHLVIFGQLLCAILCVRHTLGIKELTIQWREKEMKMGRLDL